MTIRGAIRWSLRPKRVAVLVAKLLLAGATDLAAQTTWQDVNTGVLHVSIRLEGQGHRQGQAGDRSDLKVNRELSFDPPVQGYDPSPQARMPAVDVKVAELAQPLTLEGLPLTGGVAPLAGKKRVARFSTMPNVMASGPSPRRL
jgi:hypothetical protein